MSQRVQNHDIPVHILIPKELKLGKPLIIVWIYGGYLITGAAIWLDFFLEWAAEYAIQNNAVVVMPDYRPLPESSGLDVLSDLDDSWACVENHGGLSAFLDTVGKRDAIASISDTSILAYGESAGGYLAVQSALRRPGLVKAVIAAYPVKFLGQCVHKRRLITTQIVEVDADFYSVKSEGKSPFGT